MGRDMIELPQRYAYVDSNPVRWTDPSGLCKWGLPCPAPAQWVGDRFAEAGSTIRDAYVAEAENIGYIDFNLTACFGVCVTTGAQLHLTDGLGVYSGGGVGSPTLGISLTNAPKQHITPGRACGAQVEVGPGVSLVGQTGIAGTGDSAKESEFFGEYGIGLGLDPGAAGAATCYELTKVNPIDLFR